MIFFYLSSCIPHPPERWAYLDVYHHAPEQKARVTYDNILRLSDDPDVSDVIKFLRAREIVHFQRFGEGLRLAKDKMNEKNVYYMNPAFDK